MTALAPGSHRQEVTDVGPEAVSCSTARMALAVVPCTLCVWEGGGATDKQCPRSMPSHAKIASGAEQFINGLVWPHGQVETKPHSVLQTRSQSDGKECRVKKKKPRSTGCQ